ncbi:presenilin family intramembrane aspartyl protease [Candidatus Aenigmatarchaeota archaeon]
MKHDFRVTILIISLFLAAQLVGLGILYSDFDIKTVDGSPTVVHHDTVVGERPDVKGFDAFILFAVAIVIGTVLILVIMFIGKYIIWKLLFLYAVWMTISIALGVFIPALPAIAVALVLGIWKLFKSNVVIHNITEILMYSGIAILFVPLFDIFWVVILLLLISVYDVYAVFHSKHMVRMAKFQTSGDAFAGVLIKYKAKGVKKIKRKLTRKTGRIVTRGRTVKREITEVNAILGGGDIVFPLIFSGVVLETLITSGVPPVLALMKGILISLIVTIFLLTLFVKGHRGKFYPAMPVITAGCLVGYGLIMLIA